MFSVVLAAAVAFLVTVTLGSKFIEFLQTRKFGQFVREEGPQTHLIKAGTPTMGGVVMLIGLLAALLVVARFNWPTVAVLLIVMVTAGIGLYDDWQKISRQRSEGLSVKYKFMLLAVTVVLADVLALRYVGVTQNVIVPGLDRNLVLGPGVIGIALFSIFLLLVIAGVTNAVNLTDGLDGLAAGTGAIALTAYTAIAFLERQYDVAIICGGMVGAIIGFLWFNAHPAQVFMGDTGSLAIGGVLGAAAVLTKTEMLLPVIGGLFVIEALSVIIQYGFFKATRRRVFKMAPIHHHFELSGWEENKIVVRFWIVQAGFSAAGFFLYYLLLYNAV
ncbi:MAG: phospho-N-acetylmuramoyl-pentapeptide-transferase [Actinomycetota bacterium]|nr:phospho-N-acetylmuramoyl-pentapeptide-transferase [Rubrobacter sp.]MBA3790206.1 phospho-N-acetylmuramoyl-pentapeptide-transferase [Rubrobacter sp.]MDQ3238464.1 phospho-N-acetylmuramoyl-pentapeptide-transferase [Actinomycetota bacterium]MDQ3567840.1 phospho-N-acetylmuramoyl-pentapeptide-transferase [Actinomycetota bacterium]